MIKPSPSSWSDFAAYLTQKGLNDLSIDSYIYTMTSFAKFMTDTYGEFKPQVILALDVKDYKNYLVNVKKYQPSTISKYLVVLNKYCDFLVTMGYLEKNPCADVKGFKFQRMDKLAPEVLDNLHLKRFRRAIHAGGNLRDICIYELLYNTGLRVSELCNLTLTDIQIFDRKGWLIIRSGKGGKYREVPLNVAARNAISDYLNVRPKGTSEHLLQGQRGNLQRKAINTILDKYAAQVDIGDLKMHPHLLRHQFGHDVIQNGESITSLQNILGHSNINTTARYANPTKEDMQSTVERLNQ